MLGFLLLCPAESAEWTVAGIVIGMIFCEIFSSTALLASTGEDSADCRRFFPGRTRP